MPQPADAPDEGGCREPPELRQPDAPPFFLAHGTADRFVPPAQSDALAAALEAAGTDVELLLIEGADHMWSLPDKSPAAAEKVLDATIDFFRQAKRTSLTVHRLTLNCPPGRAVCPCPGQT